MRFKLKILLVLSILLVAYTPLFAYWRSDAKPLQIQLRSSQIQLNWICELRKFRILVPKKIIYTPALLLCQRKSGKNKVRREKRSPGNEVELYFIVILFDNIW